jgi:DNA-binding CsgD family transcriptional regulator/tetratricopeptide (TPR) repeat protein
MAPTAPHHHAGMPAVVSALCAEIDAKPLAGILIDIVGPGGCGKTAVIEAAALHYAKAGVSVTRDLGEGGELAGTAMLIDDAHLLDDASLERLRHTARADGRRLLVAHRRWPAGPALTALGATLTVHRPPIVLGHLDKSATAERVAELLGASPAEPLIQLLHEQTAGLPVLLDQLVHGLQDTGQLTMDVLRHPAPHTRLSLPASVREQMRYVVEALPAEVRRVLFAAALGAGRDTETLTLLQDTDGVDVDEALRAAQATGLMTEDGEVVPLVGRLLLKLAPVAQTNRAAEHVARLQLKRGGPMLTVGRALLQAGAQGPEVASALLTAGNEALGSAPELAGELFDAAVAAGAQAPSLLADQADAAARGGRFDEALRLADEALNDDRTPGRVRVLGITAAVLAHRGMLSRAAELYRLAPATDAGEYPLAAVPVLVGIGALAEARQALASPVQRNGSAPTMLSGVESLMAHGIEQTISGSPVEALSQLARAATLLESMGSTPLQPDTPAALAALVAMHAGEFAAAGSALRRARTARLGGPPAATRHTLLLALLATIRGYTGDAHALLAAAGTGSRPLEPRDELFAAAISVGVARREGDLSALQRGWDRAREALLRHPVDLYVLLALGELVVAAARLGEQWRIEPHLRQAEAVLERLGDPFLWRVPLHWYGAHAAIVAESPPEARRHVSALAEAATASPYADVLATAAACWMRVLAGTADIDAVLGCAHKLEAAGLGAEGARLAGQAAIRATERKTMTVLLECARAVRPDASDGAVSATKLQPAAAEPDPRPHVEVPRQRAGELRSAVQPAATLSGREQEVARLVLTGLTYKEIGAQLFISAKTVEHHVARIRRRLGATSRRELFGQLKDMVGQTG